MMSSNAYGLNQSTTQGRAPSDNGLPSPTVDTNADDGGGSKSDTRVKGMHGTISASPRQTKDDPYNMPVIDLPCNTPTSTGTVNSGPKVVAASYHAAADITATTQTYDPANPPQVYFAVCQFNTTDPRDPRVQQDVLDWLKVYFSKTKLPAPTTEMSAKNGGICGVVHTVDLHMPTELLNRDTNTPFGELTLHVYGRVTMDWGDGSSDVYMTGGGPYPNSEIKHSWTTRGNYVVNAHADWIANYSLGPYNGVTYNGVLTGIFTDAPPVDFPVFEAQAMLIK